MALRAELERRGLQYRDLIIEWETPEVDLGVNAHAMYKLYFTQREKICIVQIHHDIAGNNNFILTLKRDQRPQIHLIVPFADLLKSIQLTIDSYVTVRAGNQMNPWTAINKLLTFFY